MASPTLEALESSLSSTEAFVRWAALLAAVFTALAASGGARLWLLQRAARPLREAVRRASEERISTLQSQVAEANARAEADRLARVRIEEKLAPRTISKAQEEDIVKRIRPFAGQKAIVTPEHGSAEMDNLAIRIVDVLVAAGWRAEYEGMLKFGGTREGITVGTPPNADAKTVAAGEAVASALTASGLPTLFYQWETPSQLDDLPMMITVGSKP